MASSRRKPSSKRPARRSRRGLRRLALVGLLLLVVALYAKPLHGYLGRQTQLDRTRVQVEQLRAQHARLEREIASAGSARALTREARRLFYVHPGERLYIVKGIERWQRAHKR